MSAFQEELRALINRNSMENESDTPDAILADYLLDALAAFNKAIAARDTWYAFDPRANWDQGVITPKETT